MAGHQSDNQSVFRPSDVISTAHITSLSVFDFFAVLLNILMLTALKKSNLKITEKLQIIKTVAIVLAGVLCVPLDISAATSSSFLLNVGKSSAEDVLLHTNPALFLAIALVRLRALRCAFTAKEWIGGAYSPVLLIMCLMPTIVCVITRIPWHFSLTTSEMQTKGDLYFDSCSMFVTSVLPISVGIYIYWKIYQKLTKRRLTGQPPDTEAESPTTVLSITLMKKGIKKSIMYACLATTLPWLILTIVKLFILMTAEADFQSAWILVYFKVLIIFTNPFCEGICVSNKRENLLLLYRRHFKVNRVNTAQQDLPVEQLHNADLEMAEKRQFMLSVIDEKEEKSSPYKSTNEDLREVDETAKTPVYSFSRKDSKIPLETPLQPTPACSLLDHCACNYCVKQRLVRQQHWKGGLNEDQWSQISEKSSASEKSKDIFSKMQLEYCNKKFSPAYLSRHNSDGFCRLGQILPSQTIKGIGKLRRIHSDESLHSNQSKGFTENTEAGASTSYSLDFRNTDLQTCVLTGMATPNQDYFNNRWIPHVGHAACTNGGDSVTSDVGSFQNARLTSRQSKGSTISSCIDEDFQENGKTDSVLEWFQAHSIHRYPSSNCCKWSKTHLESYVSGTTQSDCMSGRSTSDFENVWKRHSRHGSKMSQQKSIYSITSFRPSLKSVTSATSRYGNLYREIFIKTCPSQKRTYSLHSEKRLLSSLSDFF